MPRSKDTRFFRWLNGTIFHKNLGLMKLSYDDKRIVECTDHMLKLHKKPAFTAPQAARKRTQRGK